MKKLGAVLLMATMMVVGLSSVRGADAKDELKELDAKLTAAFKAGDVKLFEKHLAENYLLVDPNGMLHNKKAFLEHMAKGSVKFDELKESEVEVRTFGMDAAVITGILHLKGKAGDKDISGDYRWTRAYHKKTDGTWVCITEQHTFIFPKEKPKE
jgi:ketosteroid isomerase-like protein